MDDLVSHLADRKRCKEIIETLTATGFLPWQRHWHRRVMAMEDALPAAVPTSRPARGRRNGGHRRDQQAIL